MSETRVPAIAYFGACERAAQHRDGTPALWSMSLMGLRETFLFPVFPVGLQGFGFVFALYHPEVRPRGRISLVGEDDREVFHFDYGVTVNDLPKTVEMPDDFGVVMQSRYPAWAPILMRAPRMLVTKPGLYRFCIAEPEGRWQTLGAFDLRHAPQPPLTVDRLNAIRANPEAAKAVRFKLACTECKDELVVYAALNRTREQETNRLVWHEDLPEAFSCACGTTKVDLRWMRGNLHGFLGHVPVGEVSFARLYEKRTLESVLREFATLLDEEPGEERVQKYMEGNQVLLWPFAPQRIFFKPVILNFKADFGIVNQKGELVLVEIEKPGKRIMTKEGGVSAELQHAIGQVYDWMRTLTEHRNAVLDSMGLMPRDVSAIRGAVVMGRDAHHTSEQLYKFRLVPQWQNLDFMTYDDLIRSVGSVLLAL